MIDRACISLTNKCQLRCIYCHFDKHIDKQSGCDITKSGLRKIISNIYSYASCHKIKFKIGLVGSGEPLIKFSLIKDCIEYKQIIDKENLLSFYTISNGLCCDEDMIKWFFENKDIIKLCFSLDGDKDINDYCRKNKKREGSFDKVMDSITLYKKIFKEVPSINATVTKLTIDNKKKELSFFENIFNEVTFSRLVDEESPDLKISKKEYEHFIEDAKKTSLSLRQCKSSLSYDCTMYGKLCGVGRTNIFYANKKVWPCGRFIGNEKYILGVEEDNLEAIDKSMKRLIPVANGVCYFDTNILGRNK